MKNILPCLRSRIIRRVHMKKVRKALEENKLEIMIKRSTTLKSLKIVL